MDEAVGSGGAAAYPRELLPSPADRVDSDARVVTCRFVGGPMDGLVAEQDETPPVYAREDVGEVYVLDDAAEPGEAVYAHVSAELLARYPVTMGYALDGSTLAELERGVRFLRLFGHGDSAPLYARAGAGGRVVGIQSNPR